MSQQVAKKYYEEPEASGPPPAEVGEAPRSATKTILQMTVRVILAVAVCLAVLEMPPRVIHWWKAPLLPYYFEQGATMLPRNYDSKVSFYGSPTVRYTTDSWGARISHPALANERLQDGVFVVGDSQMLGYMVDFHQTFASRVASALTGDADAARLLAAPASHPETLGPALHEYAPLKLEKQRLAVVGLNLGNDLDEMYDNAITGKHQTGALEKWLLRNSFLYMDMVLLRSHWLKPGNAPPGINPIFYMLDAQERVILAREAARVLDELLNDPAIEADHKVLVIIPADIQVDLAAFLKYRRYYSSEAEFNKWNQQVFAAAATMNAVEEYVARQMERRGHRVIRFSKLVPQGGAAGLFDETSHHITAEGHALLAQAILDAVRSGD
jgi:hypothetical protein